MPKPLQIELVTGLQIPILYEDRSVLAIDKPAGWMLAPDSWDRTGRNLQLALNSAIKGGDHWARSRNLKYLRFVHRLDAETSGVLLLAKSPGALRVFSELFESQKVEKTYLAVVNGLPSRANWTCNLALAPVSGAPGRMQTNSRGKQAQTHFRLLASGGGRSLIEARPTTGRTHQIRVHLRAAGHPILGDPVYGNEAPPASQREVRLALRAVRLSYLDPFQNRPVHIVASEEAFRRQYGFPPAEKPEAASGKTPPGK